MIYMNIIDPITKKQHRLYSKQGKHVCNNIQFYKTNKFGGSMSLNHRWIMIRMKREKCFLKYKIQQEQKETFKNIKNWLTIIW